jgi:hypothetical protein
MLVSQKDDRLYRPKILTEEVLEGEMEAGEEEEEEEEQEKTARHEYGGGGGGGSSDGEGRDAEEVKEKKQAAREARRRASELQVQWEYLKVTEGFFASTVSGWSSKAESLRNSAAEAERAARNCEIAADEAHRILDASKGVVASISSELHEEPGSRSPLSVRRVGDRERSEIRHWEKENKGAASFLRRKLGVARSTKDVPWPRLLYLGIGELLGGPAQRAHVLRVCNASTQHSALFRQGDAIVVPCAAAEDTLLLQLFEEGSPVDQLIGSGVLRLAQSMVGHECSVVHLSPAAMSVRLEVTWVHEAQRRVESGDFYYRVAKREGGAVCLKEPELNSEPSSRHLVQGEIFKSSERVRDISDGTVYVKVTSGDSVFSRTFWLPETRGQERLLEPLEPPRCEHGQYFYRVTHEEGYRLSAGPRLDSGMLDEVLPRETVIEACEKFTPVGSPVTFVKCTRRPGFMFEKRGSAESPFILGSKGEKACEPIPCPEGQEVERVEGRAVYRVTAPEGIAVREVAHLSAAEGEVLPAGAAFSSMCRLEMTFGPGIGKVTFLQRTQDGRWVRASSLGAILVEEVKDCVETGSFYYTVIHEHGVVVRSAPDLHALPAKPHTILPMRRIFRVKERVRRAEDIVTSDNPTVFLRVDSDQLPISGEGWVFEKRQSTRICEEVTSRVPEG